MMPPSPSMLLATGPPGYYYLYRSAGAWLFIASSIVVVLALIAACVLHMKPATQQLSRHAFTVAKVFGCLSGVGVLIGVVFTALVFFR